ncbi:hypothetical protein FHS14_002129 [Paenibacillus baekrokdamisoli]|uniref:hypothetical protein n=1 Tax=Paenibacillus baekrokdamisoli TaxID=1712516 RepID=UPI000F775419|nr:hypothetical protein [Paenibacillus baekrokdamisoli]MBB3069139.1 hypothetical protein [Paenibacillus baekrokdamisoli]
MVEFEAGSSFIILVNRVVEAAQTEQTFAAIRQANLDVQKRLIFTLLILSKMICEFLSVFYRSVPKQKRSGRNRSEEAIAFAFVSLFLPLRDRIKK